MIPKSLLIGFCGLLFALAIPLSAQNADDGKPQVDVEALRQLADRGKADAQFELGVRLLGGEGVKKDEKEAVEWLQKAADQFHPAAMNALGTLSEEGVAMPKSEKKAFEWYQKAAKYGFPLAQQNLSECYETGKGVAKDPKESLKWIETAARQDFAPAQAAYAWKLEHAAGKDKNTHEAASWYLKAAQQGLVSAQTHLAYLYYTGVGVPLDYRRAEAWYRLAARSEDPWAHNDLAWFLSTCPDERYHDPETAVAFARSAVEKLDDKHYEVIDTLAASLARAGKFGEAVQTQMKAIVYFADDKTPIATDTKPEDRAKLEKELSDRLKLYKSQQPYTEKEPEAESGTKPMVEDRILQESEPPRRKQPHHNQDDDGGDKPVVIS
jgi:TPR repeat protein